MYMQSLPRLKQEENIFKDIIIGSAHKMCNASQLLNWKSQGLVIFPGEKCLISGNLQYITKQNFGTLLSTCNNNTKEGIGKFSLQAVLLNVLQLYQF